jgi:hypothetical protein
MARRATRVLPSWNPVSLRDYVGRCAPNAGHVAIAKLQAERPAPKRTTASEALATLCVPS